MIAIRRPRHTALLAAALLLAPITAFPQEPGGPPMPGSQQNMPGGPQQYPGAQQQNPGEPQQNPGAQQRPGMGNNPQQSDFQTMEDKAFISKVLENDQAQIQLSQLAQEKATAPDVKKFGQEMVNVHNQLDRQFLPAASQLGVDKPKGPSKKEKKQIEKLQSLSGQDFDAAYLQQMAVEQQEALKQFHDEQDAANSALAQTARQDASVLAQNFDILQKIAQAHNITIQAKEKK